MAHAPAFSRAVPDTGRPPCLSPCRRARLADDQLSTAVIQRVHAVTGQPFTETSPPGIDLLLRAPPHASACEERAYDISSALHRFNRYRVALPAGRAAADLSDLADGAGDKPSKAPCLTRLPADPAVAAMVLGLPPDTFKPNDFRDDHTGFRAALYRDESTGTLLLVPRDTEPHSLVDWLTNTRNGTGLDTPQYQAMRQLTSRLVEQGIVFDLAGYSKGGGLAQEAGLLSPGSNVTVFNSAGLHPMSLVRTDVESFDSLASRTQAFSADGDFLTFMNETKDPRQRIANAQFLRTELAGAGDGVSPIAVTYSSPETQGRPDPQFAADRTAYLAELDRQIARMRADLAAHNPVVGFPPVRADQSEVIQGSRSDLALELGADKGRPNLGRLMQHRLSQVLAPMEADVAADRDTLRAFVAQCG